MEKPFPVNDVGARYAKQAEDDRHEQQQRYIDRMTSRGIRVLRDDEASDKPVWRGDHTFSADAAKYSFTNFIEPEIAAEHPHLTDAEVSKRARERFEQRLAQDLAYEKKESGHVETTLTWTIVEKSDGSRELATAYGDTLVTLNELWEHTKEYAEAVGNPAAYNANEHNAQLAMQDAFIRGEASGFVSALTHPDSIRYVQVWEKTGSAIVSKQIDLYNAAGRDLTVEESKTLIERLSVDYGTSVRSETGGHTHFFVERTGIDVSSVRSYAASEVYMADSVSRRVQSAAVRSAETRSDSGAFIDPDMPRYVSRVLQETVDAVVKRLTGTGNARTGNKESRPHPSKKTAETPKGEAKSVQKDTDHAAGSVLKVKEPKNEVPAENPLRIITAEWWVKYHVVRFAPFVSGGAHAALAMLVEIPMHEKGHQQNKQDMIKEGIRQPVPNRERSRFPGFARIVLTIKDMVTSKKETHAAGHAADGVSRPENPPRQTIAGHLKDLILRNIVRLRSRRAETVPTESPVRQETREDTHVLVAERHFVLRLVDMLTVIADAMRGPDMAPAGEVSGMTDREVVPRAEEHPLRGIDLIYMRTQIIGYLLWTLTAARPPTTPDDPALDIPETHHVDENGHQAPWILFAIIWQLAMIREMGLVSNALASAQAQSQTAADDSAPAPSPVPLPAYSVLPKQGIIFTRHT